MWCDSLLVEPGCPVCGGFRFGFSFVILPVRRQRQVKFLGVVMPPNNAIKAFCDEEHRFFR